MDVKCHMSTIFHCFNNFFLNNYPISSMLFISHKTQTVLVLEKKTVKSS